MKFISVYKFLKNGLEKKLNFFTLRRCHLVKFFHLPWKNGARKKLKFFFLLMSPGQFFSFAMEK